MGIFHKRMLVVALGFNFLFSSLAYFRPTGNTVFSRASSIHAHTAKLLLDRNRDKAALSLLKRSLHSDPGNRAIAVKLAEMHFKNNELQKALDLLEPLQTLSTRKSNIYYYVARIHDREKKYKAAYVYYRKAFKLDPTLYKAKLRIAKLFIKKGLFFDAATHLKKLLEINPDYKPAIIEFELVLRLIRENRKNVFRRGNLVVRFADFSLIKDLEEWYPFLQEKIYYLQNALGIEDQVVWIKIVDQIKTQASPPALFRSMENQIYLTVDTVKRKYTSLFTHELTYMFFHQMGIRNAPKWLKEGLALYFSKPNLLKNMTLRRVRSGMELLNKQFYPDKRYLHFQKLTLDQKRNLFHAFLIVKYLVRQYGWDNLEKFVKIFDEGKVTAAKAVWEIYHTPIEKLSRDFDIYIMSQYYFAS
jgi:tetratricopeptide (TPR) repeat protein